MENKETNSELITIVSVNQLATATMLKTLLEDVGIMVFLQDVTMSQLYGNITGGIRIQVPKADAEEAQKLLAEGGYL